MPRLGSDKTAQMPPPGRRAAEERGTEVGNAIPGLEEEGGRSSPLRLGRTLLSVSLQREWYLQTKGQRCFSSSVHKGMKRVQEGGKRKEMHL